MIKNKVKEFVRERKDEIVATLMELIKIPSVSTDREACYKMLLAVKSLYEKHDFDVIEGDDYLLAYYGEGETEIGLFAHGDVVDGGENWLITSPFDPKIYNGAIVGRGAWDDKSAIVCSLYTLLALKELNIPMNKRMVCFTGFNEENGMSDIVKYIKSNTPPDFSFVLDAGFPVYYGDKGKAWLRATSKNKCSDIIDFCGGKMINITLGNAEARLAYSKELYDSLTETQKVKITKEDNEIVIRATGVSSHGANPEGSVNGGFLIADMLRSSDALSQSDREIMNSLATVLRSYYGETVGIANDDKEFGKLTLTNGIIEIKDRKLRFTLDMRFGKAAKMENSLQILKKSLDDLGFDLEIINADDAYSVDTENEYLKKYLEAFRSYTGEKDAAMRINAGSTYARCIGNACETGMRYKGTYLDLPSGHGYAHQPDENIGIDGLLNAIEIIIYAMIKINE